MLIRHLLLEYDEKKVRSLTPKFLERIAKNKDNSLPKLSGEDNDKIISLANYIEKDLDIRSGELVFWILHRYITGGINRWEDIRARLLPTIQKFEKLKNKKKLPPEDRDINRIKTLSDLQDLVDKYPDDETQSKQEIKDTVENNFYKNNEAKLIYNDNDIKVVSPKSYDASCYFGRNTRWCTASKQYGEDTFLSYANEGPLYIILIKKNNERYQFHYANNQFMDERDVPVSPFELAKKYPKLWDIFSPIAEENHSIILNKNPGEETINHALVKDGTYIQYVKNPTDAQKMRAVRNNGLALEFIKNPSEKLQAAAVRQTFAALQFIPNPSAEIQLEAIKDTPRNIRYINNPDTKLQEYAVTKEARLIKYIKNPSPAAQLIAVKKLPAYIEYIKKPAEDVQIYLLNNHPKWIGNIKNPTPKVKELVRQKFGIDL